MLIRNRQISTEETDQLMSKLIEIDQYPLVAKKSRSFKEIAQGLVN